jgi:hypothetical protein
MFNACWAMAQAAPDVAAQAGRLTFSVAPCAEANQVWRGLALIQTCSVMRAA